MKATNMAKEKSCLRPIIAVINNTENTLVTIKQYENAHFLINKIWIELQRLLEMVFIWQTHRL
jgi:hypothetical protein